MAHFFSLESGKMRGNRLHLAKSCCRRCNFFIACVLACYAAVFFKCVFVDDLSKLFTVLFLQDKNLLACAIDGISAPIFS